MGSAQFQGFTDDAGIVQTLEVAAGALPAGATFMRGMAFAPTGEVLVTQDVGQPRTIMNGIAFERDTGIVILGDAAPTNVCHGGLLVSVDGAVVVADTPEVIHQGVGLTNAGGLAVSQGAGPPELIPNPDLTTDPEADGWELNDGSTWDEPNAQIDIPSTAPNFAEIVKTPLILEDGEEYRLEYHISNYDGDGDVGGGDRIRVYPGDTATPFTEAANGVYVEIFTAEATVKEWIRFTKQGAFNYSIDYCSVKKT